MHNVPYNEAADDGAPKTINQPGNEIKKNIIYLKDEV